jgi:hypothetical protein
MYYFPVPRDTVLPQTLFIRRNRTNTNEQAVPYVTVTTIVVKYYLEIFVTQCSHMVWKPVQRGKGRMAVAVCLQ